VTSSQGQVEHLWICRSQSQSHSSSCDGLTFLNDILFPNPKTSSRKLCKANNNPVAYRTEDIFCFQFATGRKSIQGRRFRNLRLRGAQTPKAYRILPNQEHLY
jgi:hypothetical protein